MNIKLIILLIWFIFSQKTWEFNKHTTEESAKFSKNNNERTLNIDKLDITKNNKLFIYFRSKYAKNLKIYYNFGKSNNISINRYVYGDKELIIQIGNSFLAKLKNNKNLIFLKFDQEDNDESEFIIKYSKDFLLEMNNKYFIYQIPCNQNSTFKINYDSSLILDKLRVMIELLKYKQNKIINSFIQINGEKTNLDALLTNSLGLILNKKKEEYNCKNNNCYLNINIDTKNVRFYLIDLNFKNNIEKINYENKFILDNNDSEEKVYILTEYFSKNITNLESIIIKLVPIVGSNINLYVNPGFDNPKLEDIVWKEEGNLSKRWIISPSERNILNSNNKSYFIKIKNKGKYILSIEKTIKNKIGKLNEGVIENGYISKNELIMYDLEFLKNNKEINYEIRVQINSGDLNIYEKNCGKNICYFDIKTDKLDKFNKVSSIDNIKSFNNSINCNFEKCYNVIALLGTESNGTFFEISFNKSNNHRILYLNHSQSVNLIPGEKIFFKTNNMIFNKNEKIRFEFDSYFGNFNLFFSKNTYFPDLNNNDWKILHKEFKKGLEFFEKNTILNALKKDENYYLTLEGITSSSVKIHISKSYETANDNIILKTLVAGNTFKGILKDNKLTSYFTFKLFYDIKGKNKIKIQLQPIKGDFLIYVSNNGTVASKNNNIWFSNSNYLEISENDSFFKKNCEYYITIALDTNKNIDKNMEYIYNLNVNYVGNEKNLKPQTINSEIMENGENNYSIEIPKDTNNLLIIKSVKSEIKLFLKFRSSEKIDYKYFENLSGLEINREEIQNRCKMEFNENKNCMLDIIARGNDKVNFTLVYILNDNPVILMKNHYLSFPAIPKNKIQKFIYYPNSDEDVLFYLENLKFEYNIYSLLINRNQLKSKDKINFPNKLLYDEENLFNQGNIQIINYNKENLLKNSQTDNIILISIINNDPNLSNTNYDFYNHFNIQEIESHRNIEINTHIDDYLDTYSINYFQIKTRELEDINFYIETQTNNEIEIFISNGYNKLPPKEYYFLHKIVYGHSEILIKRDIDKKIEYYTIGIKVKKITYANIYWTNKLHYFVDLKFNKEKFFKLSKDKDIWFEFSNTDKLDDILFNINNKRFDYDIYIINDKDNKNIKVSLINYFWHFNIVKGSNFNNFKILKNDKNYCNNCKYKGLIKTKSIKARINIILEKIENGILELTSDVNYYNTLEINQNKLIHYRNVYNDNFDIINNVVNGIVNVKIFCGFIKENEFSKSKSISLNFHKNIDNIYQVKGNDDNYFNCSDFKNQYTFFIENKFKGTSSYIFNINNENSASPFIPGIEKTVLVKSKKRGIFRVETKPDDKYIEVRIILTKIEGKNMDQFDIEEFYKKIEDIAQIQLGENGPIGSIVNPDTTTTNISEKFTKDNEIFLRFDIKKHRNNYNIYKVWIFNDIDFDMTFKMLVTFNNYTILPINKPILDYFSSKLLENEHIYEVNINKKESIFINFNLCQGNIDLLYSIDNKKYKKLKYENDKNLKLYSNVIFIKIINKIKSKDSFYRLEVNQVSSHNLIPFNTFKMDKEEKINIDTNNDIIKFNTYKFSKKLNKKYLYQVEYQLYLNTNKVLYNFFKDCGFNYNFYTGFRYDTSSYVFLNKVVNIIKENQQDEVVFDISKLKNNTNFRGIIKAKIKIFDKKKSIMNPIKEITHVFKEFSWNTNIKPYIPVSLIINTLFLLFIFIIISIFVINYFNKDFKKISEINKFEDLNLEENEEDIMEFFKEKHIDYNDINEDSYEIEENLNERNIDIEDEEELS